MLIRPCPTCRRPVAWETSAPEISAWKPFCSEAYRIPEKPSEENGEGWSEHAEE